MAKTITLQDRLRQERQDNRDPDREKDEKDLLKKLTNKVAKPIQLSKAKPKKNSFIAPQDTPIDTPQDKDTGVHTGTPQDIPKELPEKSPQVTPEGASQDIAQGTPQDTSLSIVSTAPVTICTNDYIFLHCLKIINGEFNSMTHICKEIGKSVNTFKKVKDRLILKGLIEYNKDQYLGGLRGFKATVINKRFQLIGNKEIADKFISKINPNDLKFSPSGISHYTPEGASQDIPQGASQDISDPILSKSVSINKNLLTTQIETDLDLKYWKDKELPVEKIMEWMTEFNKTEKQMLNQLRYCAFEWKDKSKKEVQKPVGKFYVSLRGGGFSKPDDYKSPAEIWQATIDQEIAEKEKILEDIEIKQKKLFNLDYKIWLAELNPAERKKIIDGSNLSRKIKEKKESPAIDAVLEGFFKETIYMSE